MLARENISEFGDHPSIHQSFTIQIHVWSDFANVFPTSPSRFTVPSMCTLYEIWNLNCIFSLKVTLTFDIPMGYYATPCKMLKIPSKLYLYMRGTVLLHSACIINLHVQETSVQVV